MTAPKPPRVRLTRADHYALWDEVQAALNAGSWQESDDGKRLAHMTKIRDKLAVLARVAKVPVK